MLDERIGPAWMLSASPPVFLTGISYDDYLGLAAAFGRRFGNIDAGFIVYPTWTIENTAIPETTRAQFLRHAAEYPRHVVRFICNTVEETRLLQAQGLPALFMNKNFTVSESIFRPQHDVPVEFDAFYNARFIPEKRLELCALVPRVAYATYVQKLPFRIAQFVELYRSAIVEKPQHVLLNRMVDGLPVRMGYEEINFEMARAPVGLMLSAEEGSNYASMEYMLAGLAVVSTPSIGGRDVYFDPDFCLVCDPTPEAVRDAVATLQARNIPREEIRARTLEKIAPVRSRFLALVDEMLSELGASPRFAGRDWPFHEWTSVAWRPYSYHLDHFAELAAGTYDQGDQGADLNTDTQLQPQEIEQVVAAIRARPNCRLLVFGCGNDSVLWEAANAGGETAFIEDNPQWAEVTRGKLQRSAVHLVRYDTRVSQWRELLESPVRLKMRLPPEIAGKTWDVILVDGPAGHDTDTPGRMKAIFAASRLVAQGGMVFVHDSEREVEAAYGEKYLGEQRVIVSVRGRALLKGYAF